MILDWVKIALLLLKMANWLIGYLHDRSMIDEGRRQVIAENAVAIATKVKTRDQIRGQIDAMSEKQVDEELGDLVDPPAGNPPRV